MGEGSSASGWARRLRWCWTVAVLDAGRDCSGQVTSACERLRADEGSGQIVCQLAQALGRWGADAVGMSTAREAQDGRARGMECAAVSCITNRAAGLSDAPLTHEEVMAVAATQKERLAMLLRWFVDLAPGQ